MPFPEVPAAASSPPIRSRRELMLGMTGVAATVTLVAFDSTIVTTTLPRVARALDGMALYAWVGTGYLLAMAASILIFGRLGDMFGRKPLILVSLVLVALGSLACSMAQSMPQLIVFRTLQGIGGGMMIATTFAAPADLFPDPKERVKWMAMVSAAYAMSSGIGPLLGGAITQAFGWRAAFFACPVAAFIALVLIARYFPRIPPPHDEARQIDWLGGILLVVAVGAPLAALQLAFEPGASGHPLLGLALALAGLAAIALLIPQERRAQAPIFPLRVLAGRNALFLNLASFCTGGAFFILIFYSPLVLQEALHYSPRDAGLLMTPLVAATSVGSIINSRLFSHLAQPQRMMVVGGVLLAAGSLMMLAIGSTTSMWYVLFSFFVCGIALGFLMSNLTLFMQMLSERRDVGVASAVVQTTRSIGSAASTALVGIAISLTSVQEGVRVGFILATALALAAAALTHRVTMKNA